MLNLFLVIPVVKLIPTCIVPCLTLANIGNVTRRGYLLHEQSIGTFSETGTLSLVGLTDARSLSQSISILFSISVSTCLSVCLSPLSLSLYIYIYISQLGGTSGVMVIVVGNGHGDTSSNPERYWLHFT